MNPFTLYIILLHSHNELTQNTICPCKYQNYMRFVTCSILYRTFRLQEVAHEITGRGFAPFHPGDMRSHPLLCQHTHPSCRDHFIYLLPHNTDHVDHVRRPTTSSILNFSYVHKVLRWFIVGWRSLGVCDIGSSDKSLQTRLEWGVVYVDPNGELDAGTVVSKFDLERCFDLLSKRVCT
jgi:hypothetical protein